MGGRCNFADAAVRTLLGPSGIKRRIFRRPGRGRKRTNAPPIQPERFWNKKARLKPQQQTLAIAARIQRWSFPCGATRGASAAGRRSPSSQPAPRAGSLRTPGAMPMQPRLQVAGQWQPRMKTGALESTPSCQNPYKGFGLMICMVGPRGLPQTRPWGLD